MRVKIDPTYPDPRRIQQVVDTLNDDGIIIYPTDTNYGMGCSIDSRKAIRSLETLKNLEDGDGNEHRRKLFSLIAQNLSVVSQYANLNDRVFRLIRDLLPGPYTFILMANQLVPKKMLSRRQTIGIRIPDHPIVQAILAALGKPLVSISAPIPEDATEEDPEAFESLFGHQIWVIHESPLLVVDGGILPVQSSSVVDLTGHIPKILREGIGDVSRFL